MQLLIQLGLAAPLWYAAYHVFGVWPCVALLATQFSVELMCQVSRAR